MEDFFQHPAWQLVFWEPSGHRAEVYAFSMQKVNVFQ
jgi:hypothetical protein